VTCTFARAGAVVALAGEDYFSQKKRWWLRLHEKNGKLNEMPCRHKLEQYLDAYIKAAGVENDRKGPLFRAAIGKTKKLERVAMSRTDIWYMARRRASDAGIETAIGCPHFPRCRDYGLPHQRRAHRGRAAHGRALERKNHRPLRPAQR
jgi:integrase/recombinase XerD